MKYTEFKKLMEEKGFEVEVDKNRTIVRSREGEICGWVSNKGSDAFDTTCDYYQDLPRKLRRFVCQKCMELAFTPLEEREEEKKYYLKLIGFDDSQTFLNYNINRKKYTLDNNQNYEEYKTNFTQSEIDNMPECYTHPAVWEQIEVESEEE